MARDWVTHEGTAAAEAAGALIVKITVRAAEGAQVPSIDGEYHGQDLGVIALRFVEQDLKGIPMAQVATEVDPATEHVGNLVDLVVGQAGIAST